MPENDFCYIKSFFFGYGLSLFFGTNLSPFIGIVLEKKEGKESVRER
jgi:hypothetical protein